jgi:ribosomal protein S18 acetylase RimI-like enzyme
VGSGTASAAIGLLCAFGALVSWTAYAVANKRKLAALSHISPHDWSLLTGIATGALALLLAVPAFLLPHASASGTAGPSWLRFIVLVTAVGLLCSIVGNALWNRASRLLPLTLSGQLILFETLFALLYSFLWEARWPTGLECAAVALLCASVLSCTSAHQQVTKRDHLRHVGWYASAPSGSSLHRFMIIRPTTESDWETLKALRLAALLDAPTAFGVTHASAAAYTDAQWQERASARNGTEFLLAFDGEQATGMAARAVSDKQECNLIGMWVRPGYRGTPVATALVRTLLERAVAQGHRRVVLDVSPDNARAAAFYRKLGFSFLPEWEPLASYPEITVQKMEWLATRA